MTPEVSIVTPCHNSAAFLEKTAASILTQTFRNWECLLIDDASQDATPVIMTKLQSQDARFRTHFLKDNVGAAGARNQAIAMARGRFIAFLDSDDEWLPEKLATQLAFMKANGYALTYGPYEIVNEANRCLKKLLVPEKVTYRDLLKTCSIGCLTAMYDTATLGKVFMPDIRKRQDFALWLQILKKIPAAHSVGVILARYRLRSGSISADKKKLAGYQWRVYRDIEKLSWLKSIWYFAHYAIRGVLKTYF